ncbi:hypothetical protein [Mesorhizobium amorphae]|uniref:hypothetical protein n=1 Tax=Mesorhizobium amorphae TaxID=71433 RepID=UPI001111B796|nr:hypothetical protein [Mesorhizobium amorphae]GLR41866.1 hypothetical protein GCM10007880_23820 [Mesorhizobium amorphae]
MMSPLSAGPAGSNSMADLSLRHVSGRLRLMLAFVSNLFPNINKYGYPDPPVQATMVWRLYNPTQPNSHAFAKRRRDFPLQERDLSRLETNLQQSVAHAA